MQAYKFDPSLRDLIKNRLCSHETQKHEQSDLRKAAVAIVLTGEPATGQASFLLTLRPEKLNRHAGQYALPGGRLDDNETNTDAALRELQEELGLTLTNHDILGRLDDYPTRSGFRISPIVMWCDGEPSLKPDPSEVAKVFSVPLSELDSPAIPTLTPDKADDTLVLSAYFPTLGHHMYAPTAAILYQFREIALRGATTRVAHFDQPVFARK